MRRVRSLNLSPETKQRVLDEMRADLDARLGMTAPPQPAGVEALRHHIDRVTHSGGPKSSHVLNPEARYRICTVCGKPIKADPRGDVLDAAGRCDACAS